ncbi:hypothetical protein [Paraglaciecola sp.]|uniref:hypothetical protein n=1 Tax=Paraglaciecola sp. TaxID=1920173 RepID=UPI003EF9F77A
MAIQQATENQPLPSIPRLTEEQKVANLFYTKGNSAIVSYFGKVLKESRNKDDLDPVYHLLYGLFLSNSFQQLESLGEALIASYDDQLLLYVGNAKYELNKIDEAMNLAKKALSKQPNDASALRLIRKIKDKTKR